MMGLQIQQPAPLPTPILCMLTTDHHKYKHDRDSSLEKKESDQCTYMVIPALSVLHIAARLCSVAYPHKQVYEKRWRE